jgi:hypothetical protein
VPGRFWFGKFSRVAIGELNSESVIGVPEHAAFAHASVRGNAQHEFVRESIRPYAGISRKALDAHTVYVLGTDGDLWRELGTWNNARQPRDHVDGSVQVFQPLNADIAYVLGADGKLWRECGAWDNAQQPRQNVDGQVRAFQALDASMVYVLGNDGKLWREFGTWNNAMQPRIQVDGSVRSFQALDVDMVYVLGNNGNLWREFRHLEQCSAPARPGRATSRRSRRSTPIPSMCWEPTGTCGANRDPFIPARGSPPTPSRSKRSTTLPSMCSAPVKSCSACGCRMPSRSPSNRVGSSGMRLLPGLAEPQPLEGMA